MTFLISDAFSIFVICIKTHLFSYCFELYFFIIPH